MAAAVPALLGAQRFAMYGRTGNGDEPSTEPDPTGWMSGSFGLVPRWYSSRPSQEDDQARNSTESWNDSWNRSSDGRRLTAKSASGGGGTSIGGSDVGSQFDGTSTDMLVLDVRDMFADRLVCTMASMAVVISLRYFLLLWWLYRANRKYYRWEAKHEACENQLSSLREGTTNAESTTHAPMHDEPKKPPRSVGYSCKSSTVSMRAVLGVSPAPVAPDVPKAFKRFRQRRDKKPNFRGLPSPLLWPNPETLIMLIFMGGLLESSTALLGARAGGYPVPATLVALACVSLALVSVFVLSQCYKLACFYRKHTGNAWECAVKPTLGKEVEDPVLALLHRLRLLSPVGRTRGEWKIPEDERCEPQRTELALAEAFNCGLGFRRIIARNLFNRNMHHYDNQDRDTPGRTLERLASWTRDSHGGSRMGFAFQMVIVITQAILAITTGFLYAHPLRLTDSGVVGQLILNLLLQMFCAVFTAMGTANDLWHGVAESVTFALEGGASACLLAAALISQGGGGDDAVDTVVQTPDDRHEDEQVLRVAQALKLATMAASLLQAAVFAPLVLTLYDATLVPLVTRLRKTEEVSAFQTFCAFLLAMCILPLQVGKAFLGINADITDLADEYADTATELTNSTLFGEKTVGEGVIKGERELSGSRGRTFVDHGDAVEREREDEDEEVSQVWTGLQLRTSSPTPTPAN